jgi:hypothetical protein
MSMGKIKNYSQNWHLRYGGRDLGGSGSLVPEDHFWILLADLESLAQETVWLPFARSSAVSTASAVVVSELRSTLRFGISNLLKSPDETSGLERCRH